jgi:chaperonin GroES
MSTLSVKPVGDRLTVERCEPEAVTVGGIILAEVAREKPNLGKVLAISADLKEPAYAVGDTVLFTKYAGEEFQGTLILKAEEVLAVVS